MRDDEPLNALTFDIEDWFHLFDVRALEDPAQWPSMGTLVERRTDDILRLLAAHRVRATFFILGWIAARYPALVRRIADGGHEIGSHSHLHRPVFQLTEAEFRRDTLMSLDAIEAACGVRPKGYRAPSFSIIKGTEWALDTLLDCGIEWDASLFVGARGHGGYPCKVEPHLLDGAPSGRRIPELPLGTVQLGGTGLCFSGGGYLRLLPLWVVEMGFRRFSDRKLPVVVYLHPRDLAPDCPRVPMPLLRRFKSYVGLGTTMAKLEALVTRHRFAPCGDVLREHGLLRSGGTDPHASGAMAGGPGSASALT